MLFNSIDFIIFFPIVLIIYFILPYKVRYIWLLVSSYYFYMSWNAKYAFLILFSTTVTYLTGIILSRISVLDNSKYNRQVLKKLTVAVCVAVNLLILFYFKYFNFFVSNINSIFRAFKLNMNIGMLDVLLPVGISFYTFQAIGYTIDVYRGETEPERNFLRYALFVSFFPQLVAGPIERSSLIEQLSVRHKLKFENIKIGILWMLWGYFCKLVIADRVAIIVDSVYDNPETYYGCYLIVATILFGIQIYCDFNGYTMIARGCAKCFDINLMENFNAPYLSKTVAEFWRRWHISLSGWFRDYMYIPLGGNRKDRVRKYFNLFVVFFVSGMWHGAAWGYIIWGMLNGIYQIIGDLTKKIRNNVCNCFNINTAVLSHRILQTIATFALVDFSWIFFRARELGESKKILKSLCYFVKEPNLDIFIRGELYELGLGRREFHFMLFMLAMLFFVDFLKYRKMDITGKILEQGIWFKYIVYIGLFFVVLLTGIYGVGYDESQFIYFQF